MTIIRTANLTVLKTWLLGGQVNELGNHSEGFNTFCEDDCIEVLKDDNGNLSNDLIKESIELLIMQFGDDGFKHYGDIYKFKMPSEKNLNILVKRIKAKLEARNED